MDFGKARSTLEMSQADLAVALGINQATVSRFETGELTPNARTVLALEALIQRKNADGEPTSAAA